MDEQWPLLVFEQDDGTVHYEGFIGHLGHAVNPALLRHSSSDENENVNATELGELRIDTDSYQDGATWKTSVVYEYDTSMRELLKRNDIAGYKYGQHRILQAMDLYQLL
ncbi:hypothetical protein Aduo_019096 [Ancylostoma duodenale]